MPDELPEIPGFRYVRRLDKGGFSTLHLYHDFGMNRDVAVKVLNDSALSAPVRERFVSEARAMAALGNHSNIVTVYQVGETFDGHLYLMMQYCPNSDLGKLADAKPFSPERVLSIGIQIASAVQAAHEMNILHRDIKPANILVNEYNDPCLTDFGIAGQLATREIEGDVLLSVPWSPPEVISSTSNVNPGVPAEIFSLGATLWHLLAGHSPFVVPDGDNSRTAIEARIMRSSPPPTGRAPQSLEKLLRLAMATNPADRPDSAKEFAARLQAIQRELAAAETPLALKAVAVPVKERDRPVSDLTVTGKRVKTSLPIFVAQPHVPAAHTSARPAVAVTQRRPAPPPPPAPPEPEPPRPRWPVYAAAAAVTAGAITGGLILLSGEETPPPARMTSVPDASALQQNAGADNAPPGKPVITATRVGGDVLRFTWTYSAQQATDTFSWRTADGRTGVVTTPSVDVPSAGPVCVQIKVVRADGSNAAAEWSPEGCGS
ncbi:serine/threonine protein kinase [Lentzea tibetensis]|uniref:non-specific serine/threonine protein kinase n=1 Tax=Lentzea tibetensis TaxID=2591470 RepID=A0A563F270_9PSEU|nr:serine/threonine-protein kinase [Lentzea tibetensis]TWP54060.1 serine/threonine protein kinase [Lentzea tibetensis]